MSEFTFTDYYHNQVTYSFKDHPYSSEPKHVWVICRLDEKWLLTEHSRRGIEFPGGKVEEGETAEDAAVREVYEETGGVVRNLRYVGQYRVEGKGGTIIKNVYYADIERLVDKNDYMETRGPVLLKHLPKELHLNERFSFMMKDQVLPYSLEYLNQSK
ncbi:RNA deprotection pyrophosphohydrolase [Guptibacillus hwajinpoensis]|uniref:7,8-dihydro-8-oxoguanine-triphosphatase n=1 Tax=Guptibacillus hwajinpoensis TaxID=208199 RepID=A0A0J6CVW2_9BACL|nr:nucleoside triphosphatase YtkD [Alkalihalobacillus macyae]KMM37303.1 7,8-dihydro-8-oxoguanine-triphosphatase [Alkalihalobacillus macyae]